MTKVDQDTLKDVDLVKIKLKVSMSLNLMLLAPVEVIAEA